VTGCVRSKNPEGPKARVHIDYSFQKTRIDESSTPGETTLEERKGEEFETLEA
jgi:hypothetical protein